MCGCVSVFFLKPLNNRKLGALQVHKRRQQRRQNANTLRSFSFSSIQIGLPLLYLFCHCQMPFFTAAMGIRQTHKTISLKPIWTIRFKKKNTCRVSFCGRKEALLQVLTPFFHIHHAIFHHSFSGTERFSVGNRTLFLAHTHYRMWYTRIRTHIRTSTTKVRLWLSVFVSIYLVHSHISYLILVHNE